MYKRQLPEEGRYDGYLQLENGVGMMRLLETEVKERLEQLEGDDREVNATVATGRLAAPYIGKMIKLVQKKFPNVQAEVYAVKNNFFGEKITVSGLITSTDPVSYTHLDVYKRQLYRYPTEQY